MKLKSKLIPLMMIALAWMALSMITGCKKNESAMEDFSASAEELGQAESMQSDVDNMIVQGSQTGDIDQRTVAPELDPSNAFGFHSCAIVTLDTVLHTLTIDFGSGCIGRDGKTRSGIIHTTYTGGKYFDPGASWTSTFDNFYVDGCHIEGTRTVTNNGFNASNNMTWTINAVNITITKPNGSVRTWNSQRTREMIAGFGDSTCANDVYRINGTANGTRANGDTYTATISNMIRDFSCFYITSGTISFVPDSKPPRVIDFGNGTCDDIATVTLNGHTKTIHLRP